MTALILNVNLPKKHQIMLLFPAASQISTAGRMGDATMKVKIANVVLVDTKSLPRLRIAWEALLLTIHLDGMS